MSEGYSFNPNISAISQRIFATEREVRNYERSKEFAQKELDSLPGRADLPDKWKKKRAVELTKEIATLGTKRDETEAKLEELRRQLAEEEQKS